MADYVLLFRTSDEEARGAMGTPERAQRSMQAWLAWMRELETSGHLQNPGQPLDRTGSVVRGRKRVITDGPYVEAKDMVLGYTVIKAKDLEEAARLAAGCPMLEGEGSVEIRPVGRSPV